MLSHSCLLPFCSTVMHGVQISGWENRLAVPVDRFGGEARVAELCKEPISSYVLHCVCTTLIALHGAACVVLHNGQRNASK